MYVAEFVPLVVTVIPEVLRLEFHLRREDLFLGFGSEVLAGSHRDHSCEGACDGCEEYLRRVESGADDACNEEEGRDEAVVHSQDDVAQVLPGFPEVILVIVGGDGRRWSSHR